MNDLQERTATPVYGPSGDLGTLVGHYFRDAAQHSLLTEQGERRLSQRLVWCLDIIASDQGLDQEVPRTIRDVVGTLTEDQLATLRAKRALRLVRASRERLIQSNLRLAVHIARRHGNRGLAMSDLIQDGNVGLIKAVERFDPGKGFRFSTYAYWWISEEVKRCLKRGRRVVRTPDHIVDELRALQSTTMRLNRELGRTPRQSELAHELECTPGRVNELMIFAGAEVSTEAPSNDDGTLVLGDALTLGEDEAPEQSLLPRDRRRVLDNVLDLLTDREQIVLSRRYGLDRSEPETLQIISEDMGISRERVRQIEKTALAKLRDKYAGLGDLVGI